MAALVSIDNRLRPQAAALVSVFDRGFLYGDSIYEALRTYGGLPFAWEEHLARLHASAQRIGLPLPVSDGELAARLRRVLRAAGNRESTARLVITRGAGELGLDPALGGKGRVLFLVRPLHPLPASAYANGVEIAIVAVQRGPGAADPSAKTGNYLTNALALGEARRRGAHEALLADGGHVTEGATSNVFAWLDGTLITPPREEILAGITRERVLALARAAGVPVEERRLSIDEVRAARELFLTSTVREVLPVTRLDGHPVGDGAVGPATRALMSAFAESIARWLAGRV